MSRKNSLERIAKLLSESASEARHLPPTALYNEGWMLRLVLDWCSEHPTEVEPFRFMPKARWYSEALLPSRYGGRGKPHEGFTHADGVIGHFDFRPGGRGDIELTSGARQLSVIEAKMGSLLSAGTSNAPTFNQAARNLACMVQMVSANPSHTSTLERISFVVIAPRQRVEEGAFASQLKLEAALEAIRARTNMFGGKHDTWFVEHVERVLPKIHIAAVSWEAVIDAIKGVDSSAGHELGEFFSLCLKFNPLAARAQRAF